MLLYKFSLEVHSEFATLFLGGMLGGPDIAVARATCARLPRSIRLLRLDFQGVDALDTEARDGVAALIRDWRRDRFGHLAIVAGPDDLEMLVDRDGGLGISDVERRESGNMATCY